MKLKVREEELTRHSIIKRTLAVIVSYSFSMKVAVCNSHDKK